MLYNSWFQTNSQQNTQFCDENFDNSINLTRLLLWKHSGYIFQYLSDELSSTTWMRNCCLCISQLFKNLQLRFIHIDKLTALPKQEEHKMYPLKVSANIFLKFNLYFHLVVFRKWAFCPINYFPFHYIPTI